jgi:hypothetical protein
MPKVPLTTRTLEAGISWGLRNDPHPAFPFELRFLTRERQLPNAFDICATYTTFHDR